MANRDDDVLVPSLCNLRDLGGYRTRFGGAVREGMIFRSTDLSRLTDVDGKILVRLGIKTVFDLRTAHEREARPDRTPAGARHVGLDVLADRQRRSLPARLQEIVVDPQVAEREFGDGRAAQYLLESYREFVGLPSAVSSYRQLFIDLAQQDGVPALIHCTAGKDRTGWAAASLLLLVGVNEDDVFHDYLQTNELLLPVFAPIFDRFQELGGDLELLTPMLGVRREYLEAALDEVDRAYGTIEQYFTVGLGIGRDTQEALRKKLIHSD